METDKKTALERLGFEYKNGRYQKLICEINGDSYTLTCELGGSGYKVDKKSADGAENTNGAGHYRNSPIWGKIEAIVNSIRDEMEKKDSKLIRDENGISDEIQDATFEEIYSEPVPIVTLPAPVGIGGIVRPAVTASEALAAWREFQQLKKCILSKSDIQRIQGKDFIVKSGWRKFATFYNLTDRIVEESKEDIPNGYLWKIKVVCTAPNGRQTEGVGICASTERKFSHPEHDIYSTAHTRSKNRAISDMIAAGEVSYEEVAAGGEI